MLRSAFTDAEHWSELAQKYLTRYDLPNWHEPCAVEKMELWCDRLDLDYEQITNTTHQEFIELNETWPLRAFVGLLLEQRDEQGLEKLIFILIPWSVLSKLQNAMRTKLKRKKQNTIKILS